MKIHLNIVCYLQRKKTGVGFNRGSKTTLFEWLEQRISFPNGKGVLQTYNLPISNVIPSTIASCFPPTVDPCNAKTIGCKSETVKNIGTVSPALPTLSEVPVKFVSFLLNCSM